MMQAMHYQFRVSNVHACTLYEAEYMACMRLQVLYNMRCMIPGPRVLRVMPSSVTLRPGQLRLPGSGLHVPFVQLATMISLGTCQD